MEFAKYEGAGNDFILIDNRAGAFEPDAPTIARLCDRRFGIGADGLMTLAPSRTDDCSMRYYNADGSAGEMCGNGARCFALFAEHLGIGGPIKRFDAPDGLHTARIRSLRGAEAEVEVGLIDVHALVAGDGWWFLNTGVPHCVAFVDDLDAVDVVGRGRVLRHDTAHFPQGTNVDFVQVLSEGRIRLRTYERGVEDETLACGTGAAAAALVTAAVRQPGIDRFEVEVRGGKLAVGFAHAAGTAHYTDLRLTGPARRVFRGTLDLDAFGPENHRS